jgi:small-conductance mechanosensitive channel
VSTIIYLAVIITIGLLVISRASKQLKVAEENRVKRLRKRKRFALSVPNVDDEIDETEELRERRIKRVETKFAIFRKIAVPVLVALLILLAIFPYVGEIPKAVISIGLTCMGVILGMACKTPIENLAAGVILSLTQPLRIGDTVMIEKEYGVVEDIGITHSTIQLWDYRRLILNNSSLLSKNFINYSLNDKYQWAYVEFWVSYDTDIELVKEISIGVAQNSDHFADFDDPAFWVMEFDKQGIKCWVAAWAENPSEAWDLKNDMRTQLAIAFKSAGISMHGYRLIID